MDGSGLAESAGGPDLAVVDEITEGADLEAAASDHTNGALEPRGMNCWAWSRILWRCLAW